MAHTSTSMRWRVDPGADAGSTAESGTETPSSCSCVAAPDRPSYRAPEPEKVSAPQGEPTPLRLSKSMPCATAETPTRKNPALLGLDSLRHGASPVCSAHTLASDPGMRGFGSSAGTATHSACSDGSESGLSAHTPMGEPLKFTVGAVQSPLYVGITSKYRRRHSSSGDGAPVIEFNTPWSEYSCRARNKRDAAAAAASDALARGGRHANS